MSGWMLAYLVLHILGLGHDLANDGKPKTGRHSFSVSLVASAICLGILYMGGAFE
jgi:hypothetical protein